MFTYIAELKNNQINWLEEMPKKLKKGKSYKVEITILDENDEEKPKNDIVEFFRNSPMFGIELDLERDKDPGRIIDLLKY